MKSLLLQKREFQVPAREPLRACVITGTHSSVGKTTWTLGLMMLARRKNLTVQPFKVGPDYIDPGYHHLICRPRYSRNLDLFLLSHATVEDLFTRHVKGAEVAIVEGVMGLFDGKDPLGEVGSTAQLAKLLRLPILLVVDGSGMAGSAAAVVMGFQKLDPLISLAGVLVNRVAGEGHFQWLRQAIEKRTGVPCLGYLPCDEKFVIPERYLGLRPAGEGEGDLERISAVTDFLEQHFDWDRFWERTGWREEGDRPQKRPWPWRRNSMGEHRPLVGIAYDPAFSFYYRDSLDLLEEAGARLAFFSPLHDTAVPEGADLLYFGGGFPERYASTLAANESMRQALQRYYAAGGHIYAECGGLLYLAEVFVEPEGRSLPMVGLVPGRVRMTDRLQNFGYHECTAEEGTFLFSRGQLLRSHEFHYSVWDGEGKHRSVYRIGDRREGFLGDRLIATYQHLHFASDPQVVARMVTRLKKVSL